MLDACIGIDIGTTNWKAGLFAPGQAPRVESRPAVTVKDASGFEVYEPERLWTAVLELLSRFPAALLARVGQVGVTGMAEAGLMIRADDRRALSDIWPWYDPRGARYAARAEDRYLRTGLPLHGKYGAFKLLAMRETVSTSGAQWIGVPEYVVLRLTGAARTDPTLAARTYAYDIVNDCYDGRWLAELGLPETVFPPVWPSGSPAGRITGAPGFSPEATAAVCGHDHLLAASACGAPDGERVFLSTGTAQVLLGRRAKRPLTEEDRRAGLSVGPSVDGEGLIWLGSLQAAGGSVNYWKDLTGIDYARFWELASGAPQEPTGLLWLPYLNGRGAPSMRPEAAAVLAGLRASHTAGDVFRGVLEGLAYETRRVLESQGSDAERIVASGGLSRQPVYMQALSDVLGREVEASPLEEASLTGAAWLTAGRAPLADEARGARYAPDTKRARVYQEIYQRYARLLSLGDELEPRGSERG